ncbi:MAG TPA: DJ-1/PfpI family protein [Candidatus Limnocylindrales bacterium]|nr:DJ-1/PfpI family protein [Candidatus Limnocylindrales bacterium]
MENTRRRTLGVLLFPGFEVLDVYGPIEMVGNLKGMVDIVTVAEHAGAVTSSQGPQTVAAEGFATAPPLDLLLVPGGIGTRREVANESLLEWLRAAAARAEIVTSVCTGAALLARAGLLDGRRATSNKFAFSWVMEQGPRVRWVKQARWVDDGDRVTSSGVSAGMDMLLALVERLYGSELATTIEQRAEYDRHRDPTWDPFARLYGLVD